jgi:hypothetical protein
VDLFPVHHPSENRLNSSNEEDLFCRQLYALIDGTCGGVHAELGGSRDCSCATTLVSHFDLLKE